MNKIVVSIVLAVLSLMVTIVSFIINDIAAYRHWKIRERRLPPEEIVPCLPERQNIMKEYRLQTGAPKNRAAKSTFPWKDKIGSSARISGISGNVWPGLILYIAIPFINIVAKENSKL